jgi:very-short-patch-repair endonuclease
MRRERLRRARVVKEVDENAIPGYITSNPATYLQIKVFRDELKKNPTKAENILWQFLKTNQTGHHIRRQHIIDVFVADFVCLKKKVVIEVDGKIHLNRVDEDLVRTARLKTKGYRVVRFSNEEVLADPGLVASRIKVILDQIPSCGPSSGGI